MAGVGGLSSLGLFLLLLLASSSAAREERSTRAGWENAGADEIKSLVLLELPKRRTADHCSGSITSKKTVLTYCTVDPKTAYAGLLKTSEKNNAKQKREVDKVVPYSDKLSALKICILKKEWELTQGVEAVKLPSITQREALTGCTLLGYGVDSGDAQKLLAQTLGQCSPATDGELCSTVTEANKGTHRLRDLDLGGPAVCGNEQRGINKEFKEGAAGANSTNVFFDVAYYSPWIEEQKQAAEAGAAGGTGGNGTSPSSGYSIHSYLNKYSNWKVLWFLVPTIVTFLQY